MSSLLVNVPIYLRGWVQILTIGAGCCTQHVAVVKLWAVIHEIDVEQCNWRVLVKFYKRSNGKDKIFTFVCVSMEQS